MTKLPRRLDGEFPERSAIRKVRVPGPGCRCGCVIRTRIRPSGLASIKRGSARAVFPSPTGRSVRPVWIGAI